MKLITSEIRAKLLANGQANAERIADDGNTHDFKPPLKLFCPWGAATWLITEIDPINPDLAFGLCDLGMGSPELGSVSIDELQSAQSQFGLPLVERDMHFKARMTIGEYAEVAREKGRIAA